MAVEKTTIESARGLACILLVCYHALGTVVPGAHPTDEPVQYVMDSFSWIRMPLFSALSGYLFMLRPPTRESITSFAAKKFRRLGLPYFFVLLVFAAWLETPEDYRTAVIDGAINGYHHLWFLASLIWIFLGYAALLSCVRVTKANLCFAIVVSFALSKIINIPFFSINGVFYLLPYFTMGMLIRLAPAMLNTKWSTFFAIMLLISLSIHQLSLWQIIEERGHKSPIALVGSLSAVVVLFRWVPRARFLEWIGSYSYSIYLWHYLMIDITRHAFVNADQGSKLVLAATIGILVPAMIEQVSQNIPYAGALLTGRRQVR